MIDLYKKEVAPLKYLKEDKSEEEETSSNN
jgi:hypothetical protein